MNRAMIWRIATAAASLFGIGAAAYGADQHQKRKNEEAAHRSVLQRIEADLASKEEGLASLRGQLGEKNEQVRILAAEVTRLRHTADELSRSA